MDPQLTVFKQLAKPTFFTQISPPFFLIISISNIPQNTFNINISYPPPTGTIIDILPKTFVKNYSFSVLKSKYNAN